MTASVKLKRMTAMMIRTQIEDGMFAEGSVTVVSAFLRIAA